MAKHWIQSATAKMKEKIPGKEFAGPDRSYPIEDASHARNALARASQHASPELASKIRHKVHAKYPNIGRWQDGEEGCLRREHEAYRRTKERLAHAK